PLAKRLMIGATFERGELTPSGSPLSSSPGTPQQPITRMAGTGQLSYAGERLRLQARGEVRSDEGPDATGHSVDELSWLASGMVTVQPHKDLTLRGKLFFSRAKGASSTLARSSEATVGFAWRPSFTDRVALIGRYTYLDEGVPAPQAQNAPA